MSAENLGSKREEMRPPGFEPGLEAREAPVLPLDYDRSMTTSAPLNISISVCCSKSAATVDLISPPNPHLFKFVKKCYSIANCLKLLYKVF